MKDMHVQGPQINQFNNIAPKPVPRSAFKRDHTRRMTFNQDLLVPVYLDEILPGDEVKIDMFAQVRMATPIKPLMDNLYFETFWFFIPNRLVWSNWERLQGMQLNPGDSVAYTIPVLDRTKAPMSTTGFPVGSIYDYFELPTQVTNLAGISALFNRAYDECWNDWFRDENLQNSIVVPNGDGPDDPAIYTLRKRNKRKDYFTSGLPWPQKGNAVTVALGSTAPVISNNQDIQLKWNAGTDRTIYAATTGNVAYSGAAGTNQNWRFGTQTGLSTDLSTASAITINALRQAALYQQILELDARGGTRYVEGIYSKFGVVSPDFRLQRPELCGQGSTRINIYAVPQTTGSGATGQTTPQGNLSAFSATGITGGHGCRYAATEHGILLGLANVRADLTYQQGIPRMFTRSTRLDFYEPLLNGLGEQAIRNDEIYAQGNASDPLPFAYQERFAEYRFKNSAVCGLFRSTAAGTLQVWHLAQAFGALPVLNSSFIEETVPMSRVLAVPSEPSFLMDASYSVMHVRPMPVRSNPGIDRL